MREDREPRSGADYLTVHQAPWTEVMVLHAALDDAGLQPFIADANTKSFDPFITGVNPFDVRLQVPERHVEEAQRLLAMLTKRRSRDESREIDADEWRGGNDHDRDEDLEADDASDDREDGSAQVIRIARRLRWISIACLVLPLLAPFVLFILIDYWVLRRTLDDPPPLDRMSIGIAVMATVAAVAITAALLAFPA